MRYIITLAMIIACACGGGPQFRGQVVDIWGNPIEGATVKIKEQNERPMTDANGWFSLPSASGSFTVKAGKEGYIEEELKLEWDASQPTPIVRMYPRPDKAGFWVVGSAGYEALGPQPVKALGNEIKSLYGIKTLGDVSLDGSELQIIYHTDLRLDQVMTLEPQVHKLKFQRDAELVGALAKEVRVNLWVSDQALKTSLKPMKSRTDYLLQVDSTLEPGAYALTTHELLSPKSDEAFSKVAEPLRIVFPMEIR